ncbi:hypothetical protein BOTCAL_0368g00010 [Botryotinia calthae]|uniref:DNA2/NAM7 helicase helicase domain-containing protein n=1 Tax=Botryotinia calthae TaxID=38488 RepID=A0A4Y8CRY4_9HELO|nr:hypothetical protein BOTCAL_0368g00010 [Botryotinia calthae]
MEYRSYAAKRNFSSTKELETILNVGLIVEAMWDNMNIASHYSKEVMHTAIVGVKDVVGNRIFYILVSRSDEFTMPPTPSGTTLKVQFMPKTAESRRKKPFDETMIAESFGVEYNSNVAYNMKRLTVKNKGKGKQPGQNDGEEKTTLAAGGPAVDPATGEPAVDSSTATVDADAMEIEDPTPAEASKNKNQTRNKGNGNSNKLQKQQAKVKPVKKEPAFPMYSCRVIELANSPGDICIAVKISDKVLDASFVDDHFSRMIAVEKQAFNDFRDACNFNGPQRDFWQGVFGSTKFMTMLQGPPGTGKTTTVASVTLCFALLRIKTLLTAPSNTAAQECMRNLVGHLKTLYQVFPESEEWFKVIYLPTGAATRRDVSKQDDIDAETVPDMVADGEKPAEDEEFEKKNAQTWLSRRSQIKAGQNIGSKQQRIFIELTKAMTKKISEDSAIRIVVCTSSTSALLEEYKWTPWAVLIDEYSAGSEPDSYVPLAFKPRRGVLAGDHEKRKLVTRSSGHNDMHPDIAELPTNLTYNCLENDSDKEGVDSGDDDDDEAPEVEDKDGDLEVDVDRL